MSKNPVLVDPEVEQEVEEDEESDEFEDLEVQSISFDLYTWFNRVQDEEEEEDEEDGSDEEYDDEEVRHREYLSHTYQIEPGII